jgi:AcrR family transcriptional regulator
MTEATKTDGRREAGQRTRGRLIEATRVLLAERGDDAVTLRDITDAADANPAAVSYHFGCLQTLIQATIKEAIATMIGNQIQWLRELGDDSTVEQIATTMAQSCLAAICQPRCTDHAFLRIMARAISDPPPELAEWIGEIRAELDAELLAHLTSALPGVAAEELAFRAQSAIGIINFLVSGRMHIDLHDKSRVELEQLLIPVLTGALSGGASPTRQSQRPDGSVEAQTAGGV